jgi:predicted nuclease of predicted toxin-antitoxin system
LNFLFDQNISYRVAARLQSEYPGCGQVREWGLENGSDLEIWDFASRNDCSIVTFDADLHDLVTLYGHPPTVIWLRIGNTSTDNLITLLPKHSATIKAFITGSEYTEVGCLEIRQE